MSKHQILIVDDQTEVRQMLRSAVETLGSDFKVVAVPSGEEALLMTTSQTFDLLVIDVLLPGISGLELIQRVRNRTPEIKIILVTGVIDPKIRRQVADAGVHAFFLKPVETADFLDAVERSLGLVEASTSQIPIEIEVPSESVSDRLSSLRQDLDAISAFLLDDRGHILVQAGDMPDASAESNLFPALMAAFSAGQRVAHHLGQNPPDEIMYFSGPKYDLLLSHVGPSSALLVAINPVSIQDDIGAIIRTVYFGLRDLLNIFEQIGVPITSDEKPLIEEPESEDEIFDEDEAPILDAIFEDAKVTADSQDIDAFWDALVSGEEPNSMVSADALTYEQARKLGLTPEDKEQE
jgi:CheY-like chemotaxis protein/predicted regulator of Ras-like GTPase activity (Roadblock/LC7/MglB family)